MGCAGCTPFPFVRRLKPKGLMKMAALMMVWLSCQICWAQTNIISFTNSSGDFIENAVAVKMGANKLLYRTPTGGGVVKFENLSPEIQKEFNFDPGKAKEADQVELRRKQQELAQYKQFQTAQMRAEVLKQVATTAMAVEGKVVQKTDFGLLVESASERRDQEVQDRIVTGDNLSGKIQFFDNGFQVYDGFCLLTDCPQSGLADGDVVKFVAYPNGVYTYTTVGGSSKTVRQFTCNINSVGALQGGEELQRITTAKPLE
jgi:hypothetical protein